MTGIEEMTVDRLISCFPEMPEVLLHSARDCAPLIGGFVDNTPFCVVGLVPLDPGRAHIWGWNTDLVAKHPYIYARWAKRLIETYLNRYPTITGFCTVRKHKWVKSFGGSIIASNGEMSYFEVHRAHTH
jgi:hypothetical protein